MAISEEAKDYLDRVTPQIEAELRAIKLKYDTRAFVAVLANETASTYADLKAAGVYDELTIQRVFKYLTELAQKEPDRAPRVLADVPEGPERLN